MTSFQLSEPTAFADLNKHEGREVDFERDSIELKTLKYKHFRSVLKYPEEDQMHQLMLAMTGLTEDDIGELTPTDAAEISHLIFQSMKKYMELGQQILRGMEKK
ncbi:MAG: hypothetical protein P4M14_06550 [Gammaproteobacteria bacterium]|nr:hypothetical protein [Gammaproteobacteria bacterium]